MASPQPTKTEQAPTPGADEASVNSPQAVDEQVNAEAVIAADEQVTGDIKSLPEQQLVGPNQRKLKLTNAEKLRFYVLPIAAVALLLVFVFAGILPNIRAISDTFAETGELQAQYDKELEYYTFLQDLSARSAAVDAQIDKINNLAGVESFSEIVEFQERLDALADQYDLQVVNRETRENLVVEEADSAVDSNVGPQVEEEVGIIEVPSEYILEGELADIRQFVAAINSLPDLLVIGSMELRTRENLVTTFENSDSVVWQLEIQLVKYLFQEATEENRLVEKYLQVPILKEPNQGVLELADE